MEKLKQRPLLSTHTQGGNQIFVEISDDGRGLDVEAIKAKVIEKKISTAEILANMDDADIFNFIFIPGFSTAKKITDISGRGVGMNVVKETVNELNGNVSIETEKSMGTRFVLYIPSYPGNYSRDYDKSEERSVCYPAL
ncbi:MAG: ATP-binding protein [Candidatus Moduliflexus flocculans]|nr:ATP-binding protein [Candidatus Moduliflexus flocculans]